MIAQNFAACYITAQQFFPHRNGIVIKKYAALRQIQLVHFLLNSPDYAKLANKKLKRTQPQLCCIPPLFVLEACEARVET